MALTFKLLAIVVGLVYSKKVHEFWAEHHFICSVCKSGVEFSCLGGQLKKFKGCIDDTNKEYTTICSYLLKEENNIKNMCNKMDSFQICEKMNLCGNWEDDKIDKLPAYDINIVNTINNDKTSTWKAELPKRWKGFTLGQVKRTTLGSVVDQKYTYKLNNKNVKSDKAAPSSFDTRQQWPYCDSIVGNIRDQSSCGSCWAFGSTEAFNDRYCIVTGSNNTRNAELKLFSVEDTTACCSGINCGFSNGCNGGQPTAAWNWFKINGVPTGGNYSDLHKSDTCEPYTLPPCAHHVNSTEYKPCPSKEYRTPSCVHNCINDGYNTTWSKDKKYSKGSYSLRGVSNIMKDISEYGTVSAAFTVYQDFLTYKSGVYVHKTGSALGGHAIKIIGYGNENGQDYWLCVNSWNNQWGDNGYFKILKGKNECGIENDVAGGHPNL